jgi:hypothetical protein
MYLWLEYTVKQHQLQELQLYAVSLLRRLNNKIEQQRYYFRLIVSANVKSKLTQGFAVSNSVNVEEMLTRSKGFVRFFSEAVRHK